MNFRLIAFLIFLPTLITLQATAQEKKQDSTQAKFLSAHKMNYGLEAGTMFNTTSGYGSSISTYVSPHLTYSLTSRFCISAGITILTTSYNNARPYFSYPSETTYNGTLTSAILYLNGSYQLNNRLILNGTVFKEFGISGDMKSNNPFSREPMQGFSMSADYKVTEHFHIQAGFGYSKGLDPYRNSMFPGTQIGGESPFFNH